MAKGKIPGLRKVSKKEARELSKLPWVADESLSMLSEFGHVRVLPDGRVLLYYPELGNGTLYPSRAAAEEMERQLAEIQREGERKMAEQRAVGFIDPCVKHLPPIDDFLRDVDAHADSLGKAIKVKGEALDRSVASLDAVDKALKRIPRAKRPVPEILTPLVAYVGEVMRRASGGRWSKFPTTRKLEAPVYDTVEFVAWLTAKAGGLAALGTELKVASGTPFKMDDGGRSSDVVFDAVKQALEAGVPEPKPKPIRFDTVDVPLHGHDNEPMITASNGQVLDPFPFVYNPMIEPSRRLPLRVAVETRLHGAGYPQGPKPPSA
jgi:hypothetical protein